MDESSSHHSDGVQDRLARLERENAALQQALATLRQSESKYRDFIESANSIILEWDTAGQVMFVNRFGLEFFQFAEDELLGHNVVGAIVPETETSGRDLEALMIGVRHNPERYKSNENENLKKNGERVWINWSNRAILDTSGELIGIRSIGNDITERKRAEAALREREEHYRRHNEYLAALHDMTLGLVGRLDLDELLEAIITRAGQLLDTPHGYVYLVRPADDPTQDEFILERKIGIGAFSRKIGEFRRYGEGLAGRVWQMERPLVINDYDHWAGRAPDFDYNLIGSVIGVPLKSGSQVVGVLSMVYDVESGRIFDETEVEFLSRFAQLASVALDNARLYSTAQEARAAAEAANEEKSAFLASVSHELRTPLTSILGFARIIQKRLTERLFPLLKAPDARSARAIEQVNQNLDIIISEGQRLTELINDVLDLAKIEAGRIDWQMSALSIYDVVERAVAATASLYEQKGLPLHQQLPADLPEVIGDRDRLIQVVINLLSNAVKFTNAGLVTCRAEVRGDDIVISISDSGIGIARADFPLIFEKFKQVGDTLTEKPHGTGLGLSICKQIVEHHGGRIWLESELGRGTTFFFSLPLTPVESGEQGEIEFETLVRQLKQQVSISGPSPNMASILVVDDDEHVRQLLRQVLESEGYKVLEAKDGREAIAQTKIQPPDLILLDVMMPEMNGYDVAAVLRSDPQTMKTPIIILSIARDEERGYRVGVDHYLTKPIDTDILFEKIDALLTQGATTKRVLIVDEQVSTTETLAKALQARGYTVVEASNGAEAITQALSIKPDMIILNSLLTEQQEIVKTLRFEKELDNVFILLFK